MIGTRLGHYEILEAIGAGGMGEVYRARDVRLDRIVAVKVLPPQFAGDAERRARFEREARTISSLQHPGICTLHDLGESDGIHYLVMEHLEGETLSARLARGPLPLKEVLHVGAAIADALDRAHRAGIVHRDLKPGNVMLTPDGPKLLDFGLAKSTLAMTTSSILATQAATESPDASPLTAAGTVLGTFQYMSPEQLEGQEADARSDLFSLGAVLYEMTTGQRPFRGRSQASLIASILEHDPAPVTSLQPMTPPAFEHTVTRCLAKKPDDRWQTARDVAGQLRWIAGGGGATAAAAGSAAPARPGRERIAWAVAALFAVAAGALWLRDAARAPAPPPPLVRFQFDVPPRVRVDAPRVSPDGSRIAYTQEKDGAVHLMVRPIDALEARVVSGTEGVHAAIWAPDGERVAFVADGKLRVVPLAGGAGRTLADAAAGDDGAWGPGGVILYDTDFGNPIYRVDAAGGVSRPAMSIAEGESGYGWPAFLPGGDRFLCLEIGAGFRFGAYPLIVCDLESGNVLARPGDVGSRVAYAAGYLLYVRERTLVAHPFDAEALRFTGEPVPITENMEVNRWGDADFSVSPSEVLVYRRAVPTRERIVVRNRKGEVTGHLGEEGSWTIPSPSPDGKRVAVCRVASPSDQDIWMMDVERGTSTRVTFLQRRMLFPVWSPDGRELAIAAADQASGRHALYRLAASGVGEPDSIASFRNYVELACWSANGDLFGFGYHLETELDIFVLPASGGEPRWILTGPGDEVIPALSPDGKWLAYQSEESGRDEIYVRSYPDLDGKWQVSVGGGTVPIWTAGGTELLYLAEDLRMMSVPIRPGEGFSAGAPEPLWETPLGSADGDYEVMPDGKTFLVVEPVGGDSAEPFTVLVNWTRMLGRE